MTLNNQIYEQRALAKITSSPEQLDKLSRCGDQDTRLRVCFNFFTAGKTPELLRKDDDYAVRAAAQRALDIKHVLRTAPR